MRALFIVPTSEEAELVYPVCSALAKSGWDAMCIETGELCRERATRSPAERLAELGVSFRALDYYRTRNAAQVLQVERPDVLVIGNDQEYLRRAFVYAANGLGIPVLLLDVAFSSNIFRGQKETVHRTLFRLTHHASSIARKYLWVLSTIHGLRWSPLRVLPMLVKDVREAFTIEDSRGLHGCNRVAVAGSWERQVLVERGVPADIITITGNPKINLGTGAQGQDARTLKKELGIGSYEKVILFLTSAQVEHGRWTHSMRRQFVRATIDSLTPLLADSTRLVLKIHPAENLSEYKAILTDRQDVLLHKSLHLASAIALSDVVVVGGYSLTVLEAAVLDKPVVLLNLFGEDKNLPYEEMGLATCVYRAEDIRPAVSMLLRDQPTRETALRKARKFCGENREFVDGRAAERIADLLEKMTKESRARDHLFRGEET